MLQKTPENEIKATSTLSETYFLVALPDIKENTSAHSLIFSDATALMANTVKEHAPEGVTVSERFPFEGMIGLKTSDQPALFNFIAKAFEANTVALITSGAIKRMGTAVGLRGKALDIVHSL